MIGKIGVAFCFGLLMASAALLPGRAMAQAETPQRGDHLKAIPGQPLCSDVNELVAYLRTQLGIDKRRRNFKTCGPMPTGTNYTILDVSADDPEIPLRPAQIRIVAPGGASITGWTVLVSEN
jgi:hypothetical protein